MNKGLEALKELKESEHFIEFQGICDSEPKYILVGEFFEEELDIIEKELKALKIIKMLFKDRAKLYIRNDGIEQTIDKNGNYHKAGCVAYVLEFHIGDCHYVIHLHKEEYESLKEVLL